MNYNDYRTHLLTCEYLNREPTGQYKKVYDYLTDLWAGMEMVADSQNNRIVVQNEVGWVFVQDMKNGRLWCRYGKVWSFFKNDMGMEIPDLRDFVKSMVDEHLICKVGTPETSQHLDELVVDEHLICKVGTPSFKVGVRPAADG